MTPTDMATSSTPSSAARKTAVAQQAMLAELVDIAVREAGTGMEEMIRRMVSSLLDLTTTVTDPRAVMRRVKSGNLLKENSYAFTHIAKDAIATALKAEVARLTPAAGGVVASAPLELSLVPLEQIDQQMALGSVSRPFDLQYSEQLATLGVRLGLLLGRELVRAAHNPFRPDVFLSALHAAWAEFEPDPEAHGLMAPLLRPEVMFELGPMYDALIAELKSARKGKDDDTRFSKTDDRAARKAERARREANLSQQLRHLFDGGGDPALAIPDIPNLPQGSGSWRPSAAAGFDVPVPEQEETGAGAGASPAGTVPADGRAVAASAAPGFAPGPAGAAGAAGLAAGQVMPLLDLLGRLGPGALGAGAGPAAGLAAGLPAGLAAGLGAGLPAFPDLSTLGAPGQGAVFDASTPHGAYYLPRLRQSLPQGALSRSDDTTLDLLSRVFESVLLDDAVAPETRELISFLQVPVLKTALRDRSFFFEERHPARRLLDLLSQAGWEQPAHADDPVYQAMRSSIERVHAQDEPEFEAAVADLEAGLAARDRAEQAAIAGPIAQATRQEKQAAATRSAQRAVALRLAGEQVVGAVSSFLEQRWTAALALAYSIEDSRPGAIDNATRTMEDLIWSVKPKATQEQRKALIGRLPALLGSLNKWLDATRWQDGERLQFFAELADCHASIVRAPIELSPERQLELAVEAAQQDALRRVAQEQAQAEEEAEQDGAAPDALAALERGQRLELRDGDGVRKVRLAWVSPLRTLFIFSGAGRQEAFSLAAARLAELLQAGTIRVVAAEGVVGRILGEAVGGDAVNDATGTAAPLHSA